MLNFQHPNHLPMLLQIKNLYKTYADPRGGPALEVLSDLDLHVAKGESLAMLGPSGCGKSTLLNIIGALDLADRGEVLVDGVDLVGQTESQLASYRNTTVGFIFQLHHLLPQCTVRENVLIPTLALPSKTRKSFQSRADDLLTAVGLIDRKDHRPGQLSGGERQRVAVARALINQPRMILADEPTGALDRTNAARLIDLLSEISQTQDVAVILVTHAADLAARMQRVIHLIDGKISDHQQ